MSVDAKSDRSDKYGQVVDPWQAPNLTRTGGSGREIWEYESETTTPSRNLIVVTVLVVVGCIVGLSVILGLFYLFMR